MENMKKQRNGGVSAPILLVTVYLNNPCSLLKNLPLCWNPPGCIASLFFQPVKPKHEFV